MLKVVEKQKNFFNSHTTLDVGFRILQLKRLRLQIDAYYDQIISAFAQDFNKLEFDVVTTELGLIMKEINFMVKNLKRLTKPRKKRVSLLNFAGHGKIINEPYGVTLIVSPWNYPLQLTFMPLIGAIAGGNTAVIKPSRNMPNVTKVIKKMLSIFEDNYVYVVTKEEEINELFSTKFDFIFYTGSKTVARELLKAQADFITPMVLELGGKSPCIIDKDANIDVSARRVVWGKFLNAGQTCVAPDYVLVHSDIKEKWLEAVQKYITKFYYNGEDLSPDFVKVVNKSSMERLQGLIDKTKVLCGGKVNGLTLEPTVMTGVTRKDAIMQDEIFGPIMPVIEFDDLDKEIKLLNENPEKPLALYYFGLTPENIYKVTNFCQYGGGCINDVILHLTEEKLPFGGVGSSGLGAYHGERSFYTFTHEKSILTKSYKFDLSLRYPPANKKKLKFSKMYFKV